MITAVRSFKMLAAAVILTLGFTGCGGDDGDGGDNNNNNNNNGGGGGNTVSWQGKDYRTVVIGSQTWFAENVNYNAAGSKCYDNAPANCETYGRLYNWETARTACPAGWHLPSDAEWTALTDFVGGEDIAGTKLKSTSGWYDNRNGTNDYGFSTLPGGYGNSDGYFYGAGDDGLWWSATEFNASGAWYRNMIYNYENVVRFYHDKTRLYSVRCVQD